MQNFQGNIRPLRTINLPKWFALQLIARWRAIFDIIQTAEPEKTSNTISPNKSGTIIGVNKPAAKGAIAMIKRVFSALTKKPSKNVIVEQIPVLSADLKQYTPRINQANTLQYPRLASLFQQCRGWWREHCILEPVRYHLPSPLESLQLTVTLPNVSIYCLTINYCSKY